MYKHIKVKKLHEDAVIPKYMSKHASGMDLTCIEDLFLDPGVVVKARTGLALAIPGGYEGQIRARSSLASKGIIVPNAPGTIDADYRGEVLVLLSYVGKFCWELKKGARIAQLVIAPVTQVIPVECDELDVTIRGKGGFGSTGA